MPRWWEITITKWAVEKRDTPDGLGALTTSSFRVEAPTAQQATQGLVDLTTNNGRVVRFEVREIEDE